LAFFFTHSLNKHKTCSQWLTGIVFLRYRFFPDRVFPRKQSDRCVKLTTHLHNVPMFSVSGTLPIRPLTSW